MQERKRKKARKSTPPDPTVTPAGTPAGNPAAAPARFVPRPRTRLPQTRPRMILPSPQRTVRPVVFCPTAKSFPRFFFAFRSVKRDRSPHLAHPLPLFPRPFLLFCGIHRHFIFIPHRFRRFSARHLSTLPHFVRNRFLAFTRFSPQSRPVSPFFSEFPFRPFNRPSRILRFCRLIWGFSPTSALSVLAFALDPAFIPHFVPLVNLPFPIPPRKIIFFSKSTLLLKKDVLYYISI